MGSPVSENSIALLPHGAPGSRARRASAAHLNDQFVALDRPLNQARERHEAVEGFDPFGNAYLITAGGTDAFNAALDTLETCPVSFFGAAGSWQRSRQYLGDADPRGLNRMTTPRTGLALVRVGRTLYAIGGADRDTNVTTTVPALASVERARILGGNDGTGPIASMEINDQ